MKSDVIDVLNDLVEVCRDGEYGFRASAGQAHSADLAATLRACAEQCAVAAEELRAQVLQLDGRPADGGSLAGSLHRGWVAVKASLSTFDDRAVLEECERGEDVALARYRAALEHDLPAPIKTVVERQFEGARRNHDDVRRMRDALPTG